MSVGVRVQESLEWLDRRRAESALLSICPAVDATAQKELGRRGRTAYKQFLESNFPFAFAVISGVRIEHIRIAYSHPEIALAPDGTCSLIDIFYHAVRCGLLHTAELPSDLAFTFGDSIGFQSGKLSLPADTIYATILAVVLSPVNSAETESINHHLTFRDGTSVPVAALWGKRAWFESELAKSTGSAPQPGQPE